MKTVTVTNMWCSNRFVKSICIALLLTLTYFCLYNQKQEINNLEVRDVMVPPKARNIPYNLKHEEKVHYSQFHQDELVAQIFNNKVQGFFIEAGAFDGEFLSNTLHLEKSLNWTGLLIEPVPTTYQKLAEKNRKAHIINACISPDGKKGVLPIITYIGGGVETGLLAQIEGGPKNEETDKFVEVIQSRGNSKAKKRTYNIPCFPLESMLESIGNPVIDFFSLDVEGFEMSILKSIPWDKIKIKLIAIEVSHVLEGKAAIKTYMEDQGFRFYKKLHIDYFFYKPDLFTDINLSQQDLNNV